MNSEDLLGELYQAGTVADALRYASLIWPDFVETDGMIYLAFERAVQPALADPSATLHTRFASDRTQMEREFNLISVPTLFASALTARDDALERLAALLRSSWDAKLHHDFPQRRFVVEILRGDVDDPTLRFYVARGSDSDAPVDESQRDST